MSRNPLVRSTAVLLLALFLTAPLARALPMQAPRAEAAASWSGPAGLLRLLWGLVAPRLKAGSDLDPNGNTNPGPRGEAGSSLDPSGATIEEGGSLDPSGATIEAGSDLDPDGAK